MPRAITKYRRETESEYKARKIQKYIKKYNLDKIQIQELIDNDEIEIDSEILGNLTTIRYDEELNRFIIREIPKPLYSDYFSNSEFESEDEDEY